jgi:hypothetical protein
MQLESYNRELVYATAMFMDVFNNIKITRNNDKQIRVKCLNGNRSRIYKSLENPDRTSIQPPIIAVKRTSIERDSTRVADLQRHLLKQVGTSPNYDMYPPNPINITFELSIITKYQGDMDMILSNFIPFSHQSFFVKTPNPKNPDRTINHEVVWDGSISEDDKDEISFEELDLREATTQFTFKTWIWPGKAYDPNTNPGLSAGDINIKKINVQPNLCSIGVQRMIYKNGVTDADSLCAMSGFLLDDQDYYGDIYSLSHWYAVDNLTDFDDFQDRIELGRIDVPFYDNLPISANISGYVSDLGLNLDVGALINLNGSDVYYVDNEGGIVIYRDKTDTYCLNFDGTSGTYLIVPHLVGDETIISSEGTATPSISAGEIHFTAGTCANLYVSDGTIYPLQENYGTTAYDVSISGLHAEVSGATYVQANTISNWNDLYGYTLSGTLKIPAKYLPGKPVIADPYFKYFTTPSDLTYYAEGGFNVPSAEYIERVDEGVHVVNIPGGTHTTQNYLLPSHSLNVRNIQTVSGHTYKYKLVVDEDSISIVNNGMLLVGGSAGPVDIPDTSGTFIGTEVAPTSFTLNNDAVPTLWLQGDMILNEFNVWDLDVPATLDDYMHSYDVLGNPLTNPPSELEVACMPTVSAS